ncbi:uncharacterized protein M421DRAFT_8017 [Didymella exigua CBS 183.55]|uniref:DUF7730 domain-containing protein n=1 Tax=Didymella exigua CBS 183.55 TaxID=1150837 RepID=A0A6A5RIB8_9PLEO|nr:uncharacterized protein M421DRAFT_8017 [Didymella exigua CBS 183.55]KAF1925337.1 hypothetical protein M421DRAFT_8017 [Didymella exigua CBS 183.55]
MTVALRCCYSTTPPTHSQTWSEGNAVILLPIICRQLYDETHGLLYALNTFAFTDEHSMRVWLSCRAHSQRKQIRSLKLPGGATGYYRSAHNISLVAVFPQLQTIYIDFWRIVQMENDLVSGGLSQDDLVQLLVAEKSKAREKEGDNIRVIATECVYISTVLGGLVDAA